MVKKYNSNSVSSNEEDESSSYSQVCIKTTTFYNTPILSKLSIPFIYFFREKEV